MTAEHLYVNMWFKAFAEYNVLRRGLKQTPVLTAEHFDYALTCCELWFERLAEL